MFVKIGVTISKTPSHHLINCLPFVRHFTKIFVQLPENWKNEEKKISLTSPVLFRAPCSFYSMTNFFKWVLQKFTIQRRWNDWKPVCETPFPGFTGVRNNARARLGKLTPTLKDSKHIPRLKKNCVILFDNRHEHTIDTHICLTRCSIH